MATRHTATAKQRISIHALREEGDPLISRAGFMAWVFQSTPSARRATLYDLLKAAFDKFQSTPSARRATSVLLPVCWACSYFNPRPPRGGRPNTSPRFSPPILFQSTPSARRATRLPEAGCDHRCISIHALREEGDQAAETVLTGATDFNPRPPRGGRPRRSRRRTLRFYFNPRPPRGERHLHPHSVAGIRLISIHALREESDFTPFLFQNVPCDFNPRPPRGERQLHHRKHIAVHQISIHALREESDNCTTANTSPFIRFQSTPSARRATLSTAGTSR